ncbi:MAG: transposase family protein [Nostoc sp.]
MTNKFQEYFTQITDPRAERTRYHLLTDIITIAILAVIAFFARLGRYSGVWTQ